MCTRCFQLNWPACPEQAGKLGAFWEADEADDSEMEAAGDRIQDEGGEESHSGRIDDRASDGNARGPPEPADVAKKLAVEGLADELGQGVGRSDQSFAPRSSRTADNACLSPEVEIDTDFDCEVS